MIDIEDKIKEILFKENIEVSPTFKERCADGVSKFGGSWTFIFMFLFFFIGWISINLFVISFDSYPFILLNLVLSCLAVFQAPFILMSQNRMSDIDRKRDSNDYHIDLVNKLKIEELEEKLDFIIDNLFIKDKKQ